MESLQVECLRCGATRESPHPECPRCRYVGWAPVESLTEQDRKLLRERPVERRRLRRVA